MHTPYVPRNPHVFPYGSRVADLAFVLVRQPVAPAPAALVAAARRYGIELTPDPASGGDPISFGLAGGASVTVAVMPVPHPDAANLPIGLTSPPPEETASATAHLIVAALGLTGSARERDTRMAMLAAAVIDCVDAVGAMLGHGIVVHRAAVFADAARLAADEGEALMVEVAVDVTAAAESDTRMSFLTHGLRRYGREEFYVTCPIEGTGALQLVLGLARWMLADPDKHLPTGDTVGRTADEKIVIQRVPDPTGAGPEVIRLDLP
jgi:hypothetical protein